MLNVELVSAEIWSGESVRMNLVWHDLDAAPVTPTAVTYRVHDAITQAPVSALQSVGGLASTMAFFIPAADLPASSLTRRRLQVVIRGTFADGNSLPVVGLITVKKLPA